jgi:hypothetical protein
MSQPKVRTFGAGRFFGINNVSAPTPMRSITTQDQSVDFKRSTKSLFGEKQFAAEIAAGEMQVTGKVTMGGLNARMFADLLFGDGSTTGQILQADRESGTIPAATTYTVTVANSANFTTDLGVVYATGANAGKPLVCVSAAPAAGQYSVAAGVYTFAAADAGANVKLSYLYTQATSGETIAMTNQDQGPTGNFTSVMAMLYGTNQNILTLNNSIATDGGIATKGSDFAKPTFGFECATDSNDQLGTFSFAQAA